MTAQKRVTTVCILGAGGFIGSHLLARLLHNNTYRVLAIDISSDKIQHLLDNPGLTYINFNIYDTARVAEYIKDADIVISLVALCNPSLYNTIPLDVIDINFNRPLEIVRLCAEMGKWVIHFSTSEVYGKTVSHYAPGSPLDEHYILNEDTSPLIMGPIQAQRWSYAASKQLLERVVYAYGFERSLKYTIVRPFNFIGPRMDYIPGIDGTGVPRVLACFMEALMCGTALKLVDGGLARRCFTYIDDAIDALCAIMRTPGKAQGQIFNIGHPGNEVTIAELASVMIALYKELRPEFGDVDFPVENISSKAFYGDGYEDSDRRVPDITKAQTLLGWQPKTSLRRALRHTIAAYIEEYGADCAQREAC